MKWDQRNEKKLAFEMKLMFFLIGYTEGVLYSLESSSSYFWFYFQLITLGKKIHSLDKKISTFLKIESIRVLDMQLELSFVKEFHRKISLRPLCYHWLIQWWKKNTWFANWCSISLWFVRRYEVLTTKICIRSIGLSWSNFCWTK